jgi:hypothetical protein
MGSGARVGSAHCFFANSQLVRHRPPPPRNRPSRDRCSMDPTARHQAVEARFRELRTGADLPQPDNVEYVSDSLLFR